MALASNSPATLPAATSRMTHTMKVRSGRLAHMQARAPGLRTGKQTECPIFAIGTSQRGGAFSYQIGNPFPASSIEAERIVRAPVDRTGGDR